MVRKKESSYHVSGDVEPVLCRIPFFSCVEIQQIIDELITGCIFHKTWVWILCTMPLVLNEESHVFAKWHFVLIISYVINGKQLLNA
jgi:hypothetical protein